MVSALGEVINDGVIHPEEKVKVKVRLERLHPADGEGGLCGWRSYTQDIETTL